LTLIKAQSSKVGEEGPPGRGSLRKSTKIRFDANSSTMIYSGKQEQKTMLTEYLLPPPLRLSKQTSN
jgi:hypothetical protein